MSTSRTTDIVILGAGIGGFETFRSLNKLLRRYKIDAHITIIDQNNYFTFVPLLHEVATGFIGPTHCAVPLREIVYRTPHTFVNARVTRVDQDNKQIHTTSGMIDYTYCVIALGSAINYYDIPGAREYAHHVRTLDAALHLKDAFVQTIESCSTRDMSITIVGGGYTGVEIAGQYASLKKRDIACLYPDIDLHIRIIQPGDCILAHMPEKVRARVTARLEKMRVEIILDDHVTKVESTSVTTTKHTYHSDLTIWTAGFENIGPDYVDERVCERGRIKVNEHLILEQDDACYAVGDIACATNLQSTIPYPQLAEAAHKGAQHVARHIASRYTKKSIKPFSFESKGELMPVGDWYGVAMIGPITLYGRFAWWLRRTVYVLFMPGILRKLRIVFDWTMHSFGFCHFIKVDRSPKK